MEETRDEAVEEAGEDMELLPPPPTPRNFFPLRLLWTLRFSPLKLAAADSDKKLPVGSVMAMDKASISDHPAATAAAAVLNTSAEGIPAVVVVGLFLERVVLPGRVAFKMLLIELPLELRGAVDRCRVQEGAKERLWYRLC